MRLRKKLAELEAARHQADALLARAQQAVRQAEVGLIQADARVRLLQELTATKADGDQ